MIIVIPHDTTNRLAAKTLAEACEHSYGEHQVILIYVDENYYIPYLETQKTSTAAMLRAILESLEQNANVLWLTPSCVLTRPTSLDEIESEFESARDASSNLVVSGVANKGATGSNVAVYRNSNDVRLALMNAQPRENIDSAVARWFRNTPASIGDHPMIGFVQTADVEKLPGGPAALLIGDSSLQLMQTVRRGWKIPTAGKSKGD